MKITFNIDDIENPWVDDIIRHHIKLMSGCPIDTYFMYRIYEGKVLLESCLMKNIKAKGWINMNWEPITPFKLIDPTRELTDDLPFKNWKEYFEIEEVKNYVIEQGANENFLTEKGWLY